MKMTRDLLSFPIKICLPMLLPVFTIAVDGYAGAYRARGSGGDKGAGGIRELWGDMGAVVGTLGEEGRPLESLPAA